MGLQKQLLSNYLSMRLHIPVDKGKYDAVYLNIVRYLTVIRHYSMKRLHYKINI